MYIYSQMRINKYIYLNTRKQLSYRTVDVNTGNLYYCFQRLICIWNPLLVDNILLIRTNNSSIWSRYHYICAILYQ